MYYSGLNLNSMLYFTNLRVSLSNQLNLASCTGFPCLYELLRPFIVLFLFNAQLFLAALFGFFCFLF